MPFDNDGKFFYGDSARGIHKSVQTTFIQWLAAKLNDLNGAYRADFHADVTGTFSWEEAAGCVQSETGTPVFICTRGPKGDWHNWGRKIDNVFHRGERRYLTLCLEMAANDYQRAKSGPSSEEEADRDLVDAIDDICSTYRHELDALGLNDFELSGDAERQNQPDARNPHKATFFICKLNDYNP